MYERQHLAPYARTARGEQGEPETQFAAIDALLPQQLRHLPVDSCGDIGSGLASFEPDSRRKVRHGLQTLVGHIRDGRISCVHIATTDRLARHRSVWLRFQQICSEHGVEIYAGSELFSGSSQEPAIALKMQLAVEQAHRETAPRMAAMGGRRRRRKVDV